VAGLTVPYVKRIEDTIGIQEIIVSLRRASRQISEAIGARSPAEEDEQKTHQKRATKPKK
jgi:hypothetical protein